MSHFYNELLRLADCGLSWIGNRIWSIRLAIGCYRAKRLLKNLPSRSHDTLELTHFKITQSKKVKV